MRKYKARPYTIEAVQITEKTFSDPHPNPEHVPSIVYNPIIKACTISRCCGRPDIRGYIGDWIIKNNGVISIMNPFTFNATYEPADE